MTIESDDLANLRDTTSKLLMGMLWVHVPIAVAASMMRGTDWLMPALLMAAFAIAATASWRLTGNGLSSHEVPSSDDFVLSAGDEILLAGRPSARRALSTLLFVDSALEYVLSGRRVPESWIWRKLSRTRAEEPVSTTHS